MDSRRKFIRKLLAGAIAGAWAVEGFSGTKEPFDLGSPWMPRPGEEPDWAKIRSMFSFPENMAWFNTATIGLMPIPVVEATIAGLEKLKKGSYGVPKDIPTKIAEAYGADAEEIVFTQNTTQGINIIANGLPLKRGDEIILSDQEHAGNALPWLARAKRDGLKVKVLSPGKDVASTLGRLTDLIGKKTKVIALPHITCTNGQVLPAKEISKRFSDRVPFIFFDGAHGPGTTALNLHDSGCGFYAACGHKWLCGPAGTGFLYIRKDLLAVLKPLFVGAGSDSGWELNAYKQELTGWHAGAERFDFGTQNRALREGFGAALEFQQGIGLEAIQKRVSSLADGLRLEIRNLDWLEILTPEEADSRTGILTFRPKDISRREPFIQYMKNSSGFRVREVQESNLEAIRISTHIFNTPDEVTSLAEYVHKWKG